MLATHPNDLARTYSRQNPPNLDHHWSQVVQPVATSYHCDDRNAQPTEILLKCDVSIDGEEHMELPSSNSQEIAILQTGPTFFLGSANLVVRKFSFQSAREALPGRERSLPAPW